MMRIKKFRFLAFQIANPFREKDRLSVIKSGKNFMEEREDSKEKSHQKAKNLEAAQIVKKGKRRAKKRKKSMNVKLIKCFGALS